MTISIRRIFLACLLAGLFVPMAAAQDHDSDGKDHPLISRYPGSFIDHYQTSEFDEFMLPLGKLNDQRVPVKSQHLEGKITRIKYDIPPQRSILEVFRNYESSLKGAGFETLFTCAHHDQCAGRRHYVVGGVRNGGLGE